MDITVPRDTWAYWYDIINTEPRDDYQFYSSLLDSNDTARQLPPLLPSSDKLIRSIEGGACQ